jgi:hypothetical protein
MHMADAIQHEIDPSFLVDLNPERIRRYFFINQGWRMTHTGFTTISRHYQSYMSQSPGNEIMTGKVLLHMDHCVNGPWFVRGTSVFVFDPTTHFELQMVDGDINAYIDFRYPR